MIIAIITPAKFRTKERASISQVGKKETSYLETEVSDVFGKEMQPRFYTSASTTDKLNAIVFSRGLRTKNTTIDYSISTVENELNRENIIVLEWFSEFRDGDSYVDVGAIKNLLKELEAMGAKIVYFFISKDRAQQWVDAISGRHTERMPESSAAIIDSADPKTVRYYGQQLELKKAQRDEIRKQIEDSMYKTMGLINKHM